MTTADSLFPPFTLARPLISLHDGKHTACQEHHRYNHCEINFVLWSQCVSCVFTHRTERVLKAALNRWPIHLPTGMPDVSQLHRDSNSTGCGANARKQWHSAFPENASQRFQSLPGS